MLLPVKPQYNYDKNSLAKSDILQKMTSFTLSHIFRDSNCMMWKIILHELLRK